MCVKTPSRLFKKGIAARITKNHFLSGLFFARPLVFFSTSCKLYIREVAFFLDVFYLARRVVRVEGSGIWKSSLLENLMRKKFKTLPSIALLTAVYFVAGKMGLMLAVIHPSASPVWPPTGIALTALLLMGYRVWPAIFLGAFLVNISTAGSVVSSVGIAAGNTLEGVVGAYLMNRFANGRNAFDRTEDVFKFVFLAGMLSTLVSPICGVSSLALSGFAPWDDYYSIWLTWWLGDLNGDLVVAPVLILWVVKRHWRWSYAQVFEVMLFLLCLFTVSQIVFSGSFPLEFGYVPLLIWVAFRFSQRETAMAVFVLAVVAIWNTCHGLGPYATPSPNETLLLLQASMSFIAVTALVLSASVAERKRADELLRKAYAELETRIQERTSEVVKTLEALKVSEERFRLLVDSIKDYAILMLDPTGRVVSWNPGAERIQGYRAHEILGQHFSRFYLPEETMQFRLEQKLKTASETGRFEEEGWMVRKDGSRFWAGVVITAIKDDKGQLLGFSKVTRDLTMQKQAAEALERKAQELVRSNADLEQFAYVASHDLQEPLRIVKSFTQLLAKRYGDKLDKEATEFVEFIVDGVTRMQQLINDLLAYSRVGKGAPFSESLDFEVVFRKALGNLRSAIEESHAVITHDPLPSLRANPTEMLQLFQNLLSNAIKFCSKGKPCIHITAVKRQEGWLFSFRDNGIGIDPQYIDRIFVIFQRLHAQKEYPGTGIGLAICKKIVEHHGGRIWVESQSGMGSVFYFTIPNVDGKDA